MQKEEDTNTGGNKRENKKRGSLTFKKQMDRVKKPYLETFGHNEKQKNKSE